MAKDGIEDGISIETRREWAQRALEAYRKAKGEDLDDPQEEIADLMADLLHLAKSEGVNEMGIVSMLKGAHIHFDMEQEGE